MDEDALIAGAMLAVMEEVEIIPDDMVREAILLQKAGCSMEEVRAVLHQHVMRDASRAWMY